MLNKSILLIASVSVILETIIITLSGPAIRYEASIYEVYPPYFWILLTLSLSLGVFLLIHQAFNHDEYSHTIAGLTIILVSNSIFLLLPFFRRYVYKGWADLPASIGHIRDIQLTGRVGMPFSHWENPYPASHILVFTISCALGVPIEDVIKALPAFLFALFIISLYLLSKTIAAKKSHAFLITASGSLPLYTGLISERIVHPIPRIVTFLLTPLILYLYFNVKRYSIPGRIIPMLLWLLALPTWHPGDSFIFILTFLCLYLYLKLFRNHTTSKNYTYSCIKSRNYPLLCCLMLTLSWILWFINLYWFNLTVKDLALYLGIAEIENIFRTLERAEMPLLDSITLFTKMTAHLWLYFLMGAISSIYLLWKSIVQKKYMGEASFFAPLFLLYLTLCSTSYLYIPVGTVRSFNYVIFTSTILTGFTISKILEEKTEINEKKLLKTTLLTILLLPSIVFSQLNMYPSPFIKSVSDQVASSVVLGFKLFLTYQTEQLLIEDTGLNQKTKILAITGHKSIPPNVRDWQKVQQSLPEHFGYITYPNLGMWYQEDRYLIIDEMTMIYHEKAIPEYKKAWRWTSEDFDRLDHDFSVYRTYDNGGFWIFYVIALRKP